MNYFSKFEINPQRRESRKLLSNPRAMHASVLSLFPPSQSEMYSRVLWRLDSEHPRHILYVSSPTQPDFAHLQEQAGWETSPGESVEYTRFLQQVTNNSKWLFRLQANPTKSLREPGSKTRGTIIPLVTETQQIEWLLSRSDRLGFSIRKVPSVPGQSEQVPDLKVVENREQVTYKRAPDTEIPTKVTLRKTVFEGSLTVTDELALRRAMIEGIGRARAYGFGLITLRRP